MKSFFHLPARTFRQKMVSKRPLLSPFLGPLKNALGKPQACSWKTIKSTLERLLAGPRGILRLISAILGPKRLPKWSPRGSQIELERRLQQKMAKSQNSHTAHWILMIFEGQGAPFGGSKWLQHRSKKRLASKRRQKQLLKPSWGALGGLLGPTKVPLDPPGPS